MQKLFVLESDIGNYLCYYLGTLCETSLFEFILSNNDYNEYKSVFSIILISVEPSAWKNWMYYELWLYKCPKYITLAISTEKHGGLQL